MSFYTVYWPFLDRAGQCFLARMLERHSADRVWGWYHDHGAPVQRLQDIYGLSPTLVEERVSRLRDYWRRWLFGESALTSLAGPAGIVAGAPFLGVVLTAWSIEMGWAYGLDMTAPDRLDALRRVLHRRLLGALGIGLKSRAGPKVRLARLAGTMMLWGLGPEFRAADRVMAEMRDDFRREWEDWRQRSVHRL